LNITAADLVDLWGEDILHIPLDTLGESPRMNFEDLPPDGILPIEVPILFTTLTGRDDIELFTSLTIESAEGAAETVIVIGAAPEDHELLFVLNPASSEILLLDVSQSTVETVNSTLSLFVKFLYYLGRLIANDPGGRERAERAARIRSELEQEDPIAFAYPDTWWSIAFAELAKAK
jgi:hypothetical protein